MRTDNRPIYVIAFRQASGRVILSQTPYTDLDGAKQIARLHCASDETAEVCELTTVYEVTP